MIDNINDLTSKKCLPCEGGVEPMKLEEIKQMLKKLNGWEYVNNRISKTYKFNDYHQTMAFLNATAWVSHREDHHPDITVTYNSCRVEYVTHAIDGLSENDFICAAKIDELNKM